MQPDLLSPEREEQPEPFSVDGTVQSKSLPVTEVLPPDATVAKEGASPAPAVGKKRAKLNIAAIGLSFLVFMLLLAFAWVGYWAYTLNNQLAATQGQLTALQAEQAKLQTEYATLKSENEKLNTDLAQSRGDLEKANAALTTVQDDLSKSKDRAEKLDTQIDVSGKLAEILFVWTTSDSPSDIFKLDTLINETNNQELISKWNALTKSPSEDAFDACMEYLILAIRNSLR